MILGLALLLGCREPMHSRGSPSADAPARWGATLQAVVTAEGRVDFDALEAQRADLDDYLAWLAVPRNVRGMYRPDRHAFWLNTYNAVALVQVLEQGRPASTAALSSRAALPIGGELMSLGEIEHERLRMRMLDFRDHAALARLTPTSPPLRATLYTQRGLRAELEEQMRRWVNDPARGVRVDPEQAVFPALFDRYEVDFRFTSGGADPCTISARYADPELAQALRRLADAGCPRRFAPWDDALDDASR